MRTSRQSTPYVGKIYLVDFIICTKNYGSLSIVFGLIYYFEGVCSLIKWELNSAPHVHSNAGKIRKEKGDKAGMGVDLSHNLTKNMKRDFGVYMNPMP